MSNIADISAERKTTLLCEPHLIAFIGLLKHVEATEHMEKEGIIACTDGQTVWYGKEYMAMPSPQRAYVHVHELSHGMFRHSDRALLIRLMRGTINPALFNYAGDAIINEGIESNPVMPSGMFTPPSKFPPVKMAFIHKAIQEAIAFSGATPPSNYDPKALGGQVVETLYDWLVWANDAVQHKRREMEKDCPRAKELEGGKPKSDPSDDADAEKDRKANDQDGGDQKDGDRDGESQDGGDQDGDSQDQNGGDGDQDGEGRGGGKGGEGCDPNGAPSRQPCTCGRCDNEGSGSGSGSGSGGNAAMGGGDQSLTQIERMAQDKAWDLQEQLDRMKELLDKGHTTNELIDEVNARVSEARQRIHQVVQGLKMAGSGQGSILLQLENDLPVPVVPWNQVLRNEINRGLGTTLTDSYVRYGSPTMMGLARGDRRVPFSPGTTIYTERPRVLVILDVSGSHVGMLPQCFAEIQSIARKKNAVVEVMTFDDGVQEVVEIKSQQDLRNVMRKGLRGSGGTQLNGVWEHVARMRDPYRLAVVMTDGYLDAGPKPKIPVVWMITPGGTTNFPWGKVISLPEYMAGRKAA